VEIVEFADEFLVSAGSEFSAIGRLRCNPADVPTNAVPMGYVLLFCWEDCQHNSRGKNVKHVFRDM